MRDERGLRSWALSIMVTCAASGIELARDQTYLKVLSTSALFAIAAIIFFPLTNKRPARWSRNFTIAGMVAAGIGLWLHLYEPSGRISTIDVLLLGAAGKLMFVMLSFSWVGRIEWLLAALTAFTITVSTSSVENWDVLIIIAVYLSASVTWTISRLQRDVGFVGLGGWLWRASAVLVVVAGSMLGLAGASTNQLDTSWGFMRTSGGGDEASDSARRGVGQGRDEVAGADAASAGYDQTDRFTESAKDALYDLWVESYGEPSKSEDQQRMIGLKQSEVRIVQGSDRQDLRSGRKFEMRRQPPRGNPSDKETKHPALLFVDGRAPLYLRLRTLEIFDGQAWHESGSVDIPASLTVLKNDTWWSLIDHPDCDAFSDRNVHQIKLASLDTAVIPMPPATRRFNFGRNAKLEFFREQGGGLVGTRRQSLPAGSVWQTDSHTFDLNRLDQSRQVPVSSSAGRWVAEPSISLGVRMLLESTVNDHSAGWRQVTAVANYVRANGQFQHDASIDTPDPIHTFLVDRSAGSSAHFAGATAGILRSLGYRVRLISGLYADEKDRDPGTDQIRVSADDLHFWLEVRLNSGAWMPIEVTPGHELPRPRPSLMAAIGDSLLTIIRTIWQHKIIMGLMLASASVFYFNRFILADMVDLAMWRLRSRRSADQLPCSTMRLIERRAARRGNARPPHETRASWIRQLFNPLPIADFARLYDSAAYGGGVQLHADVVRVICRSAISKSTAAIAASLASIRKDTE